MLEHALALLVLVLPVLLWRVDLERLLPIATPTPSLARDPGGAPGHFGPACPGSLSRLSR